MSLSRLADVELCLIAHNLQCAEILRLARCSRRIMAAMDSPFAFQFSSLPVAAESAAQVRTHVVHDRFARHIPKTVVWPDLPLHSPLILERVLDELQDCRVHGLDVSRVQDLSTHWRWKHTTAVAPERLWRHLLSHPVARGLRWIAARKLSDDVLMLLATLPQLESLSFKASSSAPPRWPLLHTASLLTQLHLQIPGFQGTCFTDLIRDQPCFSQLRSLTLESLPLWDLDALLPQLPHAFTAMRSLTRLSLVNVGRVDCLLPAVRYAPRLWDLHCVVAQRYMRQLDQSTLLPSVVEIVHLLERSSIIVLTLRIVQLSSAPSLPLCTLLYRLKYSSVRCFGSRLSVQCARGLHGDDTDRG